MKAYCEKDHERAEMIENCVDALYACERCGSVIAKNQIIDATPKDYQSTEVQLHPDYEIVGVNTDDGLIIDLHKRDDFAEES